MSSRSDGAHQKEDFFAKAFRLSPHPIGITELETGRCLEINDACLQLYGFQRHEVIGKTTLMLGIWPDPQERAKLIARLQAEGSVRNYDVSMRTRSGDLRHFLISTDLIVLKGKRCLLTVGTDVTERKRAEESLQNAQDLLQETEKIGHVGGWEFNIDTRKQTWTDEVYRIHEVSRDFEPTVDNGIAFYAPESKPTIERVVQRAIEAGEPFDVELEFITAKGNRRWVHAIGTRDAEGRRVHGFFQDITERKRVEEELRRLNETLEQHVAERTAALRASEDRFRRVFEHAAEGIAITDLEGRFVQCNAAYAAIVGYTEQELRALQFESLIHPDDRLQNMELVRQLMSGEVPSFEVDNRYVTKSGRPAWVHKHVSMLRNDQGEPTHLMALVTDITKRKHIEAALRTVQARQHLLLTATPVVLYSRRVTPDYGVTFISENVMEQLGYSPQDFASNSSFWLNHLHPDDRPWVLAKLSQVFEQGRHGHEYRFLRQDGTYRWLHDESRLIRDSAGAPVELVGFQTDITERKRVDDALRMQQAKLEDLTSKLLTAQEREQQRIARDLHDDFTQRLAALALDAGSLERLCRSEPALLPHCRTIRKAAERLADDVNNFAYRMHPTALEHLGLEAAIRDHVGEFTQRTGLTIQYDQLDVPKAIPVNTATCLYRVVQESLQNVLKHAEASKVIVRLLGTFNGVGVCIHDDGKGFEERGAPARGLGLLSMEERVRLMEGTFRIRSCPGDGTEVHAWVPHPDAAQESTP